MDSSNNEPVVIEEVIKIDEATTDSKSERAEYAAVVFHNIPETYPDDASIQVCYTVTADLVPTTRDWVGLYKVGWMYPRDYLYYEWAPTPINYKVGYDADATIKFPANRMPKDDGEFYQFCYVSSSSQIRGASTPFQFRRPGSEDFVEIEDEESDIMVIRTKSVYLQENLQQAEAQKNRLKEAQELLQKERDEVTLKYQEVKKKLSGRVKEITQLESKVLDSEVIVQQLKKEAKDMLVVQDELEHKLKQMKKKNDTLTALIEGLTKEVNDLKAEKKKLEKERDEASGQNAILEQQLEAIKKHSQNTESSASKYSQKIEDLTVQLAEQMSIVDQLRHKVDSLNDELEKTRQDADKQMALNMQDKDAIETLAEKLRNAEDKLQAAEESKSILQKEISTYTETQRELSRQVEHSTTESNGLKQKLCDLEEDFTKKNMILECEMARIKDELLATSQEKEKLQEQNNILEQKLASHTEIQDAKLGSITIMKHSLGQIKTRLEKKEKQCIVLEKTLRQREHEYMQTEHEMRREIDDLKEKIYMCSEEYKTLYIEKNKLERKFKKHAAEKKKTRLVQQSTSSGSMCEAEMLQTSTPAEQDSDTEVTGKIERQVSEIERELEKELEKGFEKKLKYKKLYQQEKDKAEKTMALHAEQMREKNEEISKLKKQIRDLPTTWDLKVRTLEKCVSEKEKVIDELNARLRQCNQGRNDETGASMSTQRSGAPVYDNKYPYMICGNAPSPWLMYPHPGAMQYPHQPAAANVPQPPPPLVYPMPTTQGAVSNPPSGADGQQAAVYGGMVQKQVDEPIEILMERDKAASPKPNVLLDNEGVKSSLDEPLRPLPAPLEPVKMPSAKKAAVISGYDETDGPKLEDYDLTVRLPEKKPSAPLLQEKDEKERFYDAEGMAMRFCPECGMSFSADVDDQTFEDHQLSHVLGICPVCKCMKSDNMTDQDFARHVNKHYEDEEKDEIC